VSKQLSYLFKCKHCGSCVKDSKPNSGFVYTGVNSVVLWCWSMSQAAVRARLFLRLMGCSRLAAARRGVSSSI